MTKFDPLYFRDLFRRARASAFRDSEAFQTLILSLERLCIVLYGKSRPTLSRCQKQIVELAKPSPLSELIPGQHPEWHIPFSELYQRIIYERNDAVHEGAVARHISEHLAKALLVLEDALSMGKNLIRDFMVLDPATACLWQPISFVREQMLMHAYSYIPIYLDKDPLHKSWGLISECAMAKYLRHQCDENERKKRLAASVEQAIESKDLYIDHPETCAPKDSIDDVLDRWRNMPILVIHPSYPDRLMGIVTAFDFV